MGIEINDLTTINGLKLKGFYVNIVQLKVIKRGNIWCIESNLNYYSSKEKQSEPFYNEWLFLTFPTLSDDIFNQVYSTFVRMKNFKKIVRV